jgi:hypothetical protein
LDIFITPRIAPISPSDLRHPFHIGRTLGDAGRLITRHWQALLIAFMCLRMSPRVLIGEDMDAGWSGNGKSYAYDLLIQLGTAWGDFVARKIMDIPDMIFIAAAIAILLRDGARPKWFGFWRALLIGVLFELGAYGIEALPLLGASPAPWLNIFFMLILIPLVICVCLSDVAAADESLWPVAAIVRSTRLARQGFFRLLVLLGVVGGLYWLSKAAEDLMLGAIPVTDGNLLDWATTVLQECISGFYLPFQAAIFVAAYVHLRRRVDGDRPEDTAAIFD